MAQSLDELYGIKPQEEPKFSVGAPQTGGKGRPAKPSDVTAEDRARAAEQGRVRAAQGSLAAQEQTLTQARKLTKQEEARAAIASMKQAEGKPLSGEEQSLLAAAFGKADQIRDKVGSSYVAVKQRNAMHEPVKQNIASTRDAQAKIQQSQAAEYDARLQSERDIEAFRARVTLEDDMVRAGMAAKQQAQAQAMDESMQAVKESQRLVQDAAARFQRTPAIDPNREWASRTAGQKFGAVMLGIAKGLLGQDPVGHIRAAIAEDIDAQKANLDQAQRQVAVLGDAFQAQRGAYQDLRAQVDDERTADMMYERARLDQAENEFNWWMQKGGVSQLSAAQQGFLAQIQQDKANLDLQLEQRALNNPKSFTRVVSTMRPWERAAELKRADRLDEMGIDMTKEVQQQGGRERLEGLRGATERAKAEAEGYGDKNIETDTRYNSAKSGIQTIDEMLKLAEQSGGGEPGRFGPFTSGLLLGDADPLVSPEAEKFRQMQQSLQGIVEEQYGGASPTEGQKEAAAKDVGRGSGSGEMTLRALKTTRERLQRFVDQAERKLSEGHRKHRARNEALPAAEPQWGGGSVPSSFTPDE